VAERTLTPPTDEKLSDVVEEEEAALPNIEAISSKAPLLTVDEAIERIPPALLKEMQDHLRADFRDVRRWSPPKVQP